MIYVGGLMEGSWSFSKRQHPHSLGMPGKWYPDPPGYLLNNFMDQQDLLQCRALTVVDISGWSAIERIDTPKYKQLPTGVDGLRHG